MKYFYPHAVARLRVVWENFGDDTSPSLQQVYEVNVIPKSVKVNINSYVEADTFELEVDYKTFPFDPRTIRSCQVSIFMENLDKLGDPLSAMEPGEENAVFEGFADEDQMQLDDSQRCVRIKGRDFTALYIDAKWPGKMLPLDKPVDQVIAGIIGRLKATGNITVDNRTGSATLPTLAKFYPDFGALAGKRNAKQNEKYWDVIQDIANRAGLICYMELDKLVLTKPRTLYDPSKAVQFVYGKNLKKLEMTRKFGRQKGFNILVRCITGKEVLKAEIPKDSTNLPEGGDYVRIPKQSPKGAMVDKKEEDSIAPVMAFNVANVTDKAHLVEVGEKIYEELGRQQIEGSITTSVMDAPSGADVLCFNLLKLRNGTPISIVIGTDDLEGIRKVDNVAQRTQYLQMRGYPQKVATIFAQTLGKFTTPFYTKSVSFSLDADQGFRIDVDFLNFIETAGKGLGIL